MAKQIIRLSEKQPRNIVKESVQNVINAVTPNTQFFSSYDEFLNFIENTDGTIEYLYFSKEKTGLNVDIYVDDCSSYKRHKHPLWLYFCDGYSHDEKLIPIVISNNPTIPIDNCEINLSSIDFTSIIQFIKNNAQLLKTLANEMIDSISFEEQIIKTSFAFNVAESINMINEMAKDDSNLSYRQSLNAWNMIYKLMDNVKKSMSHTKQYKNTIGVSDVEKVIDYIKMSLSNIVKNTITPTQNRNNNQTNENKTMNKKQTIRLKV